MKKYLLAFVLSLIVMVGLVPCALADTVYVSTQAELETAIANTPNNTPTTIVLADGTYTPFDLVITNKIITFQGTTNAIIDNTGIQTNMLQTLGSEFTFDGVTVVFRKTNDYYQGIKDIRRIVYQNCTITGLQFMYAPEVEFTKCTFENYNDYCVWTYGATDVTFTGCTFNTGGKAILVYNEDSSNTFAANILVDSCTFNSDGTLATDKAAVETGASPYGTNTYIITINDGEQPDSLQTTVLPRCWEIRTIWITSTSLALLTARK